MPVQFGTTTVVTNGSRIQLSTTLTGVKRIFFQPMAANTGRMFVGLMDVSATVNGWELPIPVATKQTPPLELDFGDGSVLLNLFYVDSTVPGEKIDWVAVLR